jgi:biopolymer transport protein ExbD
MGRAIGFLLVLLVGIALGWLLALGGTLGIPGLRGRVNVPATNVQDNNVTTSTSSFRFVLQEDRILYQDEVIDLARFQALINEAKQQDAVVILEYDATVTGKFVEDLMRILDEAGVKYVGIG